MQFLSDVYVTCQACNGARFRDDVLEVTVQRQVDPRGARPHRRGRGALLRRVVGGEPAPAAADRHRPRLSAPRPAADDAVGRRVAAPQARRGDGPAHQVAHALPLRRADHRPALRRRREAARGAAGAGRARPLGGGDRAQHGDRQDRRLGDRPRPRRRRRRRARRRRGHAGGRRGARASRTPAATCAPRSAAPAARRGVAEAPARYVGRRRAATAPAA